MSMDDTFDLQNGPVKTSSESSTVFDIFPLDNTKQSGESVEERVKNFFPATTDSFHPKCGAVESLCSTDFLDEHRRKHLLSFKQSWDEWAAFDTVKNPIAVDKKVLEFVTRLVDCDADSLEQLNSHLRRIRRDLHISPSKSSMLAAYEELVKTKEVSRSSLIDRFLIKKIVRTHSGVLVITVLTSPGSFSCPQDCYYCPNEPGQPRSYLSTEPAVLRANQNGWDGAAQFWDRGITLHNNGHTIDKIEVLVLGGTWSGYPKAYQEEFIRDLFYAANTFHSALARKRPAHCDVTSAAIMDRTVGKGLRERLTLEEEQLINRTAACRIIGLTLETRPDHISPGELRRLRRFGCTRVQIGIQHVDNVILEKINRGCSLRHAVRAIRLLKDACFKVDIHLMPDLPGSSPEKDKEMFENILSSTALQADQWKIYPCEITPFSEIEKWYKQGRFIPYTEAFGGLCLAELILKVKLAVHPWIRLNRVVRDIPNPSIIAGNDKTNLRQMLLDTLKKKQLRCRCLRCREVTTKVFNTSDAVLKIREYPSFGGVDFFLSFETRDEHNLFAFLRLRFHGHSHVKIDEDPLLKQLNSQEELRDEAYDLSRTFPELQGCGLIRELHVYETRWLGVLGLLVGSNEKKSTDDMRHQHSGFGKKLLAAAEILTLSYRLNKMAVIAGVGTTEYYRKYGYDVENYFMTKHITTSSVTQCARALDIHLPLEVQFYEITTMLGPLLHSTTQHENLHKNLVETKSIANDILPTHTKMASHCVLKRYVDIVRSLSFPRQIVTLWNCMGIRPISVYAATSAVIATSVLCYWLLKKKNR